MSGALFDLTGKVAVVTGGTGALGSGMCRALAGAGASVVILARTEEKTVELAQAIRSNGGRALGVAADVMNRDSLQAASAAVQAQFGRVDILVNGAGGNHPEATAMPGQRTFFDLPEAALRHVFDLNLIGTVLPSQVFGARMATQETGGVILNVSSMASMQPLTRVVAYGAAKAAINNFTQWLAVDMATNHRPNVRVNAIAPGFFLGDQNRYLLQTEEGDLTPRGQQIIDHTPMGRFGDPDDLTGTLLWLVSDASRFVTGIVVPVDGGFSAFSGV
jgi:NAD(P)-dependent dehydrogenase (short-subunit alcohol dehydrogenase family)